METLQPFSQTANAIKPGTIYEHYKGNRYKVISVGRHCESLEEQVIYESLYGEHDFWVRPISTWVSTVDINGQPVPRFRLVE